jgi:hypothetical protein
MAMAAVGHGQRRIGVELALKPGDRGSMEWDTGKRLIRREGGDTLMLGRAFGDRVRFHHHAPLAGDETAVVGSV